MASIFTKIINGEIPSYKIAETADFIAILDIMPLVEGHVLVIPKKEIDFIFDLDDQLLQSINLFAKRVSMAIQKSVNCKRIGVSVVGLEVPHAHMHLVPINSADDLNFTRPKLNPSKERLSEMAKLIESNFE